MILRVCFLGRGVGIAIVVSLGADADADAGVGIAAPLCYRSVRSGSSHPVRSKLIRLVLGSQQKVTLVVFPSVALRCCWSKFFLLCRC